MILKKKSEPFDGTGSQDTGFGNPLTKKRTYTQVAKDENPKKTQKRVSLIGRLAVHYNFSNKIMTKQARTGKLKNVLQRQFTGRSKINHHKRDFKPLAFSKPNSNEVRPVNRNYRSLSSADPIRDQESRSNKFRKSLGRPIGLEIRRQVEPFFGMHFGAVRIYQDHEIAGQVGELGADAITEGDNIYLGPNSNDLNTVRGRALLVHELTHVRQQRQMQQRNTSPNAYQIKQFESEALANERAALNDDLNAGAKADSRSLVKSVNASNMQRGTPIKFITPQKVANFANQNITPANTPMAAPANRNVGDLANSDAPIQHCMSNTEIPEEEAQADDDYYSLKLRLRIEKERMGS